MSPRTKLWPLDEHTLGKHLVLRSYLEAWLPIMSKYNQRLLIIDGFAGPGEYAGGEPGSPIIALDALIEHTYKGMIRQKVTFYFIEQDTKRCEHLDGLIKQKYPFLPDNIIVRIINGNFDKTMSEVLQAIDDQNKRLAPCFAMIDPFGVSHTPMSIMTKLLKNPSSEVYVSFMYSHINRFKSSKEFQPHLNELFGDTAWQKGLQISDQKTRKNFFYQHYKYQLKQSGAEHVVYFELYRGNSLVYAIFFATKHLKGCDKMKQAIWKIALEGDLKFKGTHSEELSLTVDANFTILQQALANEFSTKQWVTIEEIQDYVASDFCDFHTSHTKSKALKPLEINRSLIVNENTRNRKNTYPKGTLIYFVTVGT